MKKVLAVLLLSLVLISACGPTCTQQGYIEITSDIEEQWHDALDIANSTARMSLSGPIGDMQQIIRDYKKLEVPECYSSTHGLFIDSYEQTVDAFLAFMSSEEDSVVQSRFRASENTFDRAMRELWKLPDE